MKQLLSALLLCAAVLPASAQSYDYLTFKKTTGEEASLSIDKLKITFANDNLVATNGTETFTAPVADMSKMFFSTNPTAVSTVVANDNGLHASIVNGQLKVNAPAGSRVSVYSIDGRQVGTAHLTKGTYLVRVNNQTLKVIAQ